LHPAIWFTLGAAAGLALALGYAAVSRWRRLRELRRRIRAQVEPPPQEILLQGGPCDGKRIKVRRGIEYVMMPQLARPPAAQFTDFVPDKPLFEALRYQRDLSHYNYVKTE